VEDRTDASALDLPSLAEARKCVDAPAPTPSGLDEPFSADENVSPPVPAQSALTTYVAATELLPRKLERVTLLGLEKLEQVLCIPTNHADGNLLRAQTTAAGIAVNAQLRADETRLRAKVQGDVLERLLKAIEREKISTKKLEREGM
jgi:hypothetical protein